MQNLKVRRIEEAVASVIIVLLIYFLFIKKETRVMDFDIKDKQENIDSLKKVEGQKMFSNDSLHLLLIKNKVGIDSLNKTLVVLEKQSKTKQNSYEKQIIDINSNTILEDIEFFTKNLPSSQDYYRRYSGIDNTTPVEGR